jgi:hypothetical protein
MHHIVGEERTACSKRILQNEYWRLSWHATELLISI